MLKNTPAGYKKEHPWLKEADSLALANVQMNLEGAFRKFFREPKVGFPNYKSKKHSRKSYTTNMVNGNIHLQKKFLKLPKMTPVKINFAMHGLCVFSTGERAGYPMFYRSAEKKLAREQRKLSRCEKGSRNFCKI